MGGGSSGFGADAAHWYLAGLRFSEVVLEKILWRRRHVSRYVPLIGLSCLSE